MNQSQELQEMLGVWEGIETAQDLVSELDKVISKSFPKSLVDVQFTKKVGLPGIDIRFAFWKDPAKWPNQIERNDPIWHQFSILAKGTRGGIDDDGTINAPLEVTILTGGSIKKNGQRLVKLPWRNKKGAPEAIVKHFKTYFERVKKAVDEFDGDLFKG